MAAQLHFDFEEVPERLLGPDEVFERADSELIQKVLESRILERKSAGFSGSSLGEYICMWANTSPDGGIVAIGITDKGEYEGCMKLSQDKINNLEKVSTTFCPDAKVLTKQVRVRNLNDQPDFIMLFRVFYNSDSVVKTTNGKAFIRRGDSKHELKPEEIRELQADKGQISFEKTNSGLKYPEAFDLREIEHFVAKVRKPRKYDDKLSSIEILELRRLGMIRENRFLPNIACALLFAKDPQEVVPGCRVHFKRFEDVQERTGTKYNPIKDQIYEGTIPLLIQQMTTVLESQLRVYRPLDANGKFFPVPEYPREAWLEAIVNACVHRSYGNGMKNMPIYVKMFDDRLVIESPGPFPPTVNSKNIYNVHNPRNPIIMDAMFYMEYVRMSYEGCRRIRDTMVEMKLPPPVFEEDDQTSVVVRVTLKNNIKHRRSWIDSGVGQFITEAVALDLTDDEKRVLNWTAEHDRITISDCQKLLSRSWQGARKTLDSLVAKRLLQYIRFREHQKNVRDPKAFYRIRSSAPLPAGAYDANGK